MSAQIARGAVVLGAVGLVASWQRVGLQRTGVNISLVITACSTSDDGVHTPAESVTLYGSDKLVALREAINAALGEESSTGGAA